jgi:hypothetical protein
MTGWVPCDKDEECSSNKCFCVPVTKDAKKRGRCKTGVTDSVHEDIWRAICEKKASDDEICMHFINNRYGTLLVQLDELEKTGELDCLLRFTDVSALPAI